MACFTAQEACWKTGCRLGVNPFVGMLKPTAWYINSCMVSNQGRTVLSTRISKQGR